jgi:RNA polymerase sigma-70 factor (ECF subfamily)
MMMPFPEHDFEQFYGAHRDRLVATLHASFPDLDACASAVDEAMVRAFARWSRIGTSPDPAAWVFVTARNVARRQVKRQRRTNVRGSSSQAIAPPPAGETWLVVADLPARQREAVVLRHLLGLTERGVAVAMGVTRGTVSSTLRDAYASLSLALQDNEREVNT